MGKTKAAITGVDVSIPEHKLTNQDLEKMVETDDEWIKARTGIESRRILKGEKKGASVMGSDCARKLCEKKGIDPEEIDLLICATVTPDYLFPATANIIGQDIGAKNAWSFDLSAACSGFIYALATGAQFIESGMHNKVMIVGVDQMSAIIDYEDRATCVIFGDGGGAVMLEPSEDGCGVIDSALYSDGSGKDMLYQKAGGSAYPPTHETVENREHFVYQEGKAVFKYAVNYMAEVGLEVMKRNQLSSEDVDWFVPHQANLRIIESAAKKMNLPLDKVMINIQRYGNTTAGTLPICLWEWENKLKKGDNLILSAFGGGFTWGATYVKWAYDN
ncbi:MAG: beta-ketoacyl-ACP synthase III [Flavobacteriales bacterium]